MVLKDPPVYFIEETTSTNDHLAKMVNAYTPEWTCVVAAYQKEGKGQYGSKWYGDRSKNLLISVYLRPDFLPARKAFALNMMASLAVSDVIGRLGKIKTLIKWPNDILANSKKMAGILIQNSIRSANISDSIIGVGLNLNEKDFPEELPNATSLAIESGKEFDRVEMTLGLIDCMRTRYRHLRDFPEEMEAAYRKRLFRLNEFARYRVDGCETELMITGIDEDGKLVTVDRNGRERRFGLKEIGFILP